MSERTERITDKKVREAFDAFKSNAIIVGFDATNWDLIPPQFVGAQWCIVDRGNDGHAHNETPFPTHLGAGTREAHAVLRAMSKTLFAVAHLQNGSN